MVDSAAMAVDGGVADGGAGGDMAHAAAVGQPDTDRFTDPEILRQFRPCGSYYAHAEPVEVVGGILRVTEQGRYDMCICHRARAHTCRVHARYESFPGLVDVMAEAGSPDHAGDRVAEVHGDPFFGNQGHQRRAYEVMLLCNEVVRGHVPLHRSHLLVYSKALLLPLKGTETFEAAANSFCRLLRNWPKAVFLKRNLATDPAVPFGHDSGLKNYLDQLALVAHDEDDCVDKDRSHRISEAPNPFRLPMFPSYNCRAADTRFLRNRELLPTAWAA